MHAYIHMYTNSYNIHTLVYAHKHTQTHTHTHSHTPCL